MMNHLIFSPLVCHFFNTIILVDYMNTKIQTEPDAQFPYQDYPQCLKTQ